MISKICFFFLLNQKFEDPGDDDEEGGTKKKGLSEIDHARRDCKARSVLNKFKQMEQKMLNGEDEDEGTIAFCFLFVNIKKEQGKY